MSATWRSGSGSAQTLPGVVGLGSATSRMPRASASAWASRIEPRRTSSAEQSRGLGSGGRATYIRSRRIRCARWAWVMIARSERIVSASSARTSSNWARPTITASGLFSSWPAPAANSARASSFARRRCASSVSLRRRNAEAVASSLRRSRVRSATSAAQAPHASTPGQPSGAGSAVQSWTSAAGRAGSPSGRIDARGSRGLGRGRGGRLGGRGRVEPDDPGGGDARLVAPGQARALGPDLGTLGRVGLGERGHEAVACVALAAEPGRLEPQRGVLAAEPLLARRGVGVDERAGAPRLDLGHEQPDSRVERAGVARRGARE